MSDTAIKVDVLTQIKRRMDEIRERQRYQECLDRIKAKMDDNRAKEDISRG